MQRVHLHWNQPPTQVVHRNFQRLSISETEPVCEITQLQLLLLSLTHRASHPPIWIASKHNCCEQSHIIHQESTSLHHRSNLQCSGRCAWCACSAWPQLEHLHPQLAIFSRPVPQHSTQSQQHDGSLVTIRLSGWPPHS
jgi:hypothetical protein